MQLRHLEEDVRIAEENGMRFGDSLRPRGVTMPESRRLGNACTDSLFADIEQLHSVSPGEIEALRGKRDLLIDITTIYVPITILLILSGDRVMRRVRAGCEPEERWPRMVALAAMAPVVGAVAAVAAHMWSWQVESARLGDWHLSYRADRLPIGEHPLAAWLIATAIVLGVAATRRV